MTNTLAEIKGLSTYFHTEEGIVKAVDDVSFSIPAGRTVAVVGESGCGKSVTALSVMRLVAEPGRIEKGEIRFGDQDLLRLREGEMRGLRGNDIAMVFQEPMSSLNPVLTIGEQLIEPLMEHRLLSKKEARAESAGLITRVGIPRAEEMLKAYPHELSGGMLQRIMIAIALSCQPKLLIADEPTTALDVTVQAQILDLLNGIKAESNTAILLITHDLGVVAEMADHVVVMYAGKVIEEAPVIELFQNPRHPYTKGLLRSKPVIGRREERLYSIPGQVPQLIGLGEACAFADRCESCLPVCRERRPVITQGENGHLVACWLYEEGVSRDE
ncbi:ABC transporter ATP-binding protein [Tumebacillus sp. DT12]|uniref:ABC transporter ATP-binding protein n=1 Tax=Tumebacillus lacus TaxID=2995335 RepID=A0ABT3X210_9BACL|nr:ABC transporter ATP-binding protein [Tumebacillus lacus]MCX7570929.1 ABC transporter ATP-binding protein [Tumebacillus lacus]